MRPLIGLVLIVLGAGCGPTMADELRHARSECESAAGTATQREQFCQQQQRAVMAAYSETPTHWHESAWAFRLLVAQKLDAGAITPAEAQYVTTEYEQRLAVEAFQAEAARNSANAAEITNSLTIWRALLPPPRY